MSPSTRSDHTPESEVWTSILFRLRQDCLPQILTPRKFLADVINVLKTRSQGFIFTEKKPEAVDS